MSDQAAHLRQLVLRAARQRESESLPPPRIVAVLGAHSGLGVTTIAAGLGRAMVEQAARVVLIDADRQRRDLARACGLAEIPESFDAAVARQDIHEALLPGPGGLQVVPGIWDSSSTLPWEKGAQRLLRQFQQLGRHADWLVLDLGGNPAEVLRLWREAVEAFVVVTTPASAAVMDTYTLIKQSLVVRAGQGIELLVNQTRSDRQAAEVFQRVDRSCRRFLGFAIQSAGHVPLAAADPAASLASLAARLCEGESETKARASRAA